ncbi:MAG: aminotransferase class I/II-fold pyridoxal phosphate-dependent enzyme, partial [Acholeplasmatales bacterium]|nr:aminotransferase class I/II-fold pyridoxal phosphate-dependent enzyme [Acholeplasmatales bacterium]
MVNLSKDIIEINKLATKAALKDKTIINATIGSLFDEEEKLFVHKVVDDVIKNKITDSLFYGYGSIDGGETFNSLIKKWIFGPHLDKIKESFNVQSLATPGSTMAVNLSLNTFSKYSKNVLLPSYYWSNYDAIIDNFPLKTTIFNYIKDDVFDFSSFEKNVNKLLSHKNSLIIL